MTGRRIPVALAFTMTWLGAFAVLTAPERAEAAAAQAQDAKRGPPGAPAAEKSAVLKTEACARHASGPSQDRGIGARLDRQRAVYERRNRSQGPVVVLRRPDRRPVRRARRRRKDRATFRLTGNGQYIARFARMAGGSDGLFAFNPWGKSVVACSGDGTKLWEESGGDGVDDVWAADFDGDGVDEAIVGYNGGTGLHLFSPDGKRLWKRTDIGNVWHVTAGDVDGDGKPEVVTTSARGKVHIFSPLDGKPLRTLDAGLYASMVRTALGERSPRRRAIWCW